MKKTTLFVRGFRTFMMLCCCGTATLCAVPASAAGSSSPVAVNQQKTVSVKVTVYEEDGKTPVIGATVSVARTNNAVPTDVDGVAELRNVPANGQIEVTYVGMEPALVNVGASSDIKVILKASTVNLEEAIVVGYGTTKKANLTGSVATVSSKAIENRPLQTVSQALQGQVPGVVAIQNSGRPGSQSASITIRGKNTINAGGPYVLIDGVPGDMNNMDPNDVESISILKDAASAAIYGVQAANGVILITTKKGKSNQKATVNYTGSYTLAEPTVLPSYLGSYDYAVLYNESQYNENNKIQQAQYRFQPEDLRKYQDGSSPYTHANTDWYAETFRKLTNETQHYLSINGGTDKTVYSASVGWTYQNGKTDNNFYNRYNARFNVENQATKWLKIGMNLSGFVSENNMGWDTPEGLVQYTNRLAPIYPVYTDATETDYYYAGMQNPIAEKDLGGYRKYKRLEYSANLYAQVNILPKLSIKAVYANRGVNNNDTGFQKAFKYGKKAENLREGYNNSNYTTRETIQLLANWEETWGKHTVALLAGYEQYQSKYTFAEASRKGGGNNDLGESLNTLDPSNQYNKSGGNDMARQSYFGRVQYNFNSKYFFEANVRADASSRFAKDNRWGYFPSFSAAWRISQEKFMAGSSNWLSNLKLRVGYGKTGNEEVDGNYEYMSTYAYESYIFGETKYPTVYDKRYANADLRWATITNYEGAIEAGFLNNKLGFELAVYHKITDDMLLRLPVDQVLGADKPLRNAGQVTNTGFDLNLFYNDRFGDVGFNVSANVGYVKNKIINLKGSMGESVEGPTSNDKYWYIEGESIGSFYGYRNIGMFRDAEDVKNSPKLFANDVPGNLKYADIDGYDPVTGKKTGKPDGKINAADREVIGTDFPAWTGGITVSANWKGLDLSLFFQGAFGAKAYLDGEASYAFYNGGKVLERHLDRWTPTNLDASYPRITNSYQGNFQTSSFWLQDMSYVRLKNVTLGYTFPKSVSSAIGMSNLRVYFSGENLFTFTDVKDWDPETTSTTRGGVYSNMKKYSFGLKFTF